MINRPSRIVMGFACLVGITAVGLRGASAGPGPRDERRGEPNLVRDRLETLERRVATLERRLEIPTTVVPREPASPRLAGRWLMTLPAGFEHRVTLEPVGPDRYRLKATRTDPRGKGDNRLVFAGLYEIRDGRLVIFDPDDSRRMGFGWTIHNPNTLILADQPEAGTTGADYLGASLTRQVDD
jgi:hypothetical protein